MPAPSQYQKLGHDPIDHATLVNQQELKLILTEYDASTGTTYIGKAAPGTLTSEPYWQIQRTTKISGIVSTETKEFADNGAYTQIWNNRVAAFPPFVANGNIYSLSFDGVNDFVSLGDNFNFERTDPFSVFCWVKDGGTAGTKSIISKRQSGNPQRGWELLYSGASSTLSAVLCSTANTNILQKTSLSGFTVGAWNYVGFTYDGTSAAAGLNLYLNGTLVGVTINFNTLSATIVQTVTSTASMGGKNGANSPLIGNVDEVTIWNKALTGAEVATLFSTHWRNPTLAPYAANLIHQYRNGDGDLYPVITDRVGTVNGTMTNMAAGNIVADAPV